MWLAEAACFLASQKSSAGSADVEVLQERQKKLKVNFSLQISVLQVLHSFIVYSKFVILFNSFTADITEFAILLG